jgi:mRNA interferase HigB
LEQVDKKINGNHFKNDIECLDEKYPDARFPLQTWYYITKNLYCKHFEDLKNSFNSADSVGNNRYVFNIKGNKYRLIALIIFRVRTIFVLLVCTQRDYDKIDVSKIEFKK